MSRIKYHYAKNQDGVIINIADVVKEDRKSQRFFCISCGAEMIPKLGEVKARHFAHKAETPNCNSETYLHKLTKLCLKNKFLLIRDIRDCLLAGSKMCGQSFLPILQGRCMQREKIEVIRFEKIL